MVAIDDANASDVVLAAAPSVPQDSATLANPSSFGTAEMLSSIANYLSAMQSTINSFGVLVTILTVIVGVLGVLFTVAGWLAQRRAVEEAQKLRAEAMEEIRNAHASHHSELKTLREIGKTQIDQAIKDIQQAVDMMVERRVDRVERTFSSDITARLNEHDKAYAAALLKIETVLYTFQAECSVADSNGREVFDFLRYNTLRHLLTRLLSGSRADISAALERLNKEFAPRVGRSTADFLKQLVEEFNQAGRFGRAENHLLASHLISTLESRLA